MEPHGGLQQFVSSVGKMRKAGAETILDAAKIADGEMIKNGIVATGDISNSAETLDIKRNSRIRYHTFIEMFGLDGNRAKEIYDAAKNVKRGYDNAKMPSSLVPHAAYSLSPELWELLHQSHVQCPPQIISIHHQESSIDDENAISGKNQKSKIVNQKLSIKNCQSKIKNCLLVHNTFSTEKDLKKYTSQPERFYFVLCPGSNLFIQNRLPDFHLFSRQETSRNVCLGTDSLASNTCLSILEEMKTIQRYAPEIPVDTLLRWACLNGARALGFDDFCGSFEKGKTPGVNLITGIDFENMKLTAKSEVTNFVFN